MGGEELLQAVIDNAAVLIVVLDRNGRIVRFNKTCELLTGYKEAELVGEHISTRLLPADEAMPVSQVFLELLGTAGGNQNTNHWCTRDGGKLLIEWTNSTVQIQGSVQYVIGVGVDVTASEQERIINAKKTAALDASLNAVAIADLDGTLSYINSSFLSLWGYDDAAEVVGRSALSFWREPEKIAPVMAALQTQGCWVGELEHALRKDGSTFIAKLAARVVHDSDGTPLCMMSSFLDVSALRAAESEAETNRRRFEAFYNASPDGILFADAGTGSFLSANPKWHSMFRYGAEDLPHIGIHVLHPPEDVEKHFENFSRMVRGELDVVRSATCLRKDGTVFYADISALPMETNGKFYLAGVFRDVTGQVIAEQALRSSEEKYRLLVNNTNECIVKFTPDWRLTFVNPTYCKTFGPRASELLGKSFIPLISAEDRDRVLASLETLKRPPHTCNHEERAHTVEGERIFAWSNHALVDAKGAIVEVVAVGRDITMQKAQEQKLRQWAAAFENTVEGVLITDAESNIIDVNQAFVRLTGYTKEEVLGQKPSIRRSQLQTPEFFREMWQTLRDSGSWKGEIWNRKKDGEIAPEWLTITTLYDEVGRPCNYVGVFTDISAIKESEQRLAYLANHDPLTDLPNRSVLNDRIEQALRRAHREGVRLALLFLDLDHFKTINDTLGHPVGDRLLIEVAVRLRKVLRESDTFGRLGGDEFLVLIESFGNHQEIDLVAEKIIAAMTEVFVVDGHELYVGCSIGVSIGPDDGLTAAALIQNADTAMYKSKDAGRNTFHYYSSEFTAAARQRLELEVELRHALERDELELYYQPKIYLHDGSLRGAEVLLRWNNPRRGMVPPDVFIPLAEDNGLIVAIGSWVLDTACRELADWHQRGLQLEHLAVNVSGIQVYRGNLTEVVDAALTQNSLDASALEIEITESILMHSPEKAREVLQALRTRGVSLALDDFGTGYSSLSNLKDFPFSVIKIDRTFVEDIDSDSNDEAIIKAVIAMGRSLELDVVAEGVETSAQETFLLQHGCHLAQGYLYSKPLPHSEFEALLQQQASWLPVRTS